MHYKYLILFAIVNILYLVSRKRSVPKSLPNLLTKLQQIPRTNFLSITDPQSNSSNIEQNGNSSEEDTVMDLEYSGNWYQDLANNNSNLFDYFSQDSGFAMFTGHLENSNSQTEDIILIEMFNGQYIDRKLALLFINYTLADFNQTNMTYANNSMIFTYNLGYSDTYNSESNYCEGAYELNFIDVTTNQPFTQQIDSDNYENIGANIYLSSPPGNCSFSLNATMAITDTTNENMAMIYAIFATLICIVHVVACLSLIKLISQNDYEGNHFSLITLGTFTCWDVFLCLFNLYIALSMSDYFHYFITPAFWYFILSAIFETRVMLLCWRTRYYSQFQNTTDFRRAISKFYFHLYGSLLLVLFLGYFFLPDAWFLYLTAPFLVPQIAHNAIKGQKVKFNWQYMFLLGFLRVGIPVYVKSYDFSVFRYTPDPSFAVWYPCLVLFQILIAFLQSKIGPRFFIPSMFLPPKYNYYIKLNLDDPGIEEENCSICLSSYLEEANVVSSKDPLLKKSKNKTVTVMKTPCNHKYHEKCLKDWMEFKLECPFCRAKLPPL